MTVSRSRPPVKPVPHQELLERIAQRYEQLDEQLAVLEAKLRDSAIGPEIPRTDSTGRPRQPR